MHKYQRTMETMDRKKIICPIELNFSMDVNKANFCSVIVSILCTQLICVVCKT